VVRPGAALALFVVEVLAAEVVPGGVEDAGGDGVGGAGTARRVRRM